MTALRRTLPGVLFVAWLYGVPFLFIVALVRSTARYRAGSYDSGVGALTAAVVLDLVLPVAGALAARVVARPAGEKRITGFWVRHFNVALVLAVAYLLAIAAVGGVIGRSVGGHAPGGPGDPAPRVSQCIPRSGGHGCPGG